MNKERAIDIVKKALALSRNNPSAEEAETAFLKAQEIMVKYDLTNEDIEGGEKIEKEVKQKRITDWGRTPFWKKWLAVVIADNFRCESWSSTQFGKSAIFMLGLKEDVELSEELYNFAIAVLEHSYKDYMRLHGGDTRDKNSYICGFIQGLDAKLKQQAEQNNWGLVLVKDALVVSAASKLGIKAKTSNISMRPDSDAYDSGYQRGKSLTKHKELSVKN